MKTLISVLIILISLAPQDSSSQLQGDINHSAYEDPCGYPDTTSSQYLSDAAMNWGYSYDSLKADLGRWSQSPFVRIDSVGATVHNRAMYLVTIEDTTIPPSPRKRVWIHARTHPNEVQGTWVTNEMIHHLLSSSAYAKRLRDSCVFNIMPMYNPDGVELARPRQNANNVDLESNWAAGSPQPEVQVLRGIFLQLMAQPNPIRVALNMHSALACRRYFVYHVATGTSSLFATMQQNFIGAVRNSFTAGIEPYTYFVSWTSTPPPTVYPESWFWYNHREAVLANTYEDMNCAEAGNFDLTAKAVLDGIGDFLNVGSTTNITGTRGVPQDFRLEQNYPNPFNPVTTIRFSIPQSVEGLHGTSLRVFDMLGRGVATLVNEDLHPGNYESRFNAHGIASGVYVFRLQVGRFVETKKLVVLR